MGSMFQFFIDNAGGIAVLLLSLVVACGVLQWVLWLFGLGRFRDIAPREANTRYILTQLLVKVITDFRHFLALVIILVFAIALFASVAPGAISSNVDDVAKGVQAVAAGLGGLIGLIVGYYFGESAARREMPPQSMDTGPEVQEPTQEQVSAIRPAGKPKALEGSDLK
jgi:hypothetical protein